MKESELRLGNYIQDENGILFMVSGLPMFGGIQITSEDTVFSSDTFKPIPLTEEWLLKFGFIKSNDTDSFYHIGINNEWTKIYVNAKHGLMELSINNHGCLIKSSSVHQLQNLYFALTSEELTLKTE